MSLKRISLKDIAQKVGVSTALVSYVLNNQKEGRISKEVAQRIRETACALNYRPNQAARSLKTNRTLTLGLIVSDISNSFSALLARFIEDEAEKQGYTVLFGSSDESASKSARLVEILLNHQVDGLIIAPVEGSAGQLSSLQQAGVPFVLIDRYFPELEVPYVAIDNYKASLAAVRHLAAGGSSRIGLIGFDTTLFHLRERERGYHDSLKEAGLVTDSCYVKRLPVTSTHADVEKAVNELLSLPTPADALLFASNTLSTHALKYLNTLDITVPADLAIVSFDQSDAAELFYSPLTYIRQPLAEMAQTATRLLLESLNAEKTTAGINMEAELVLGKSSVRTG